MIQSLFSMDGCLSQVKIDCQESWSIYLARRLVLPNFRTAQYRRIGTVTAWCGERMGLYCGACGHLLFVDRGLSYLTVTQYNQDSGSAIRKVWLQESFWRVGDVLEISDQA